jgi:hypothetical protein
VIHIEGKSTNGYRVAVTSSNDVQSFGPPLPNPPVFTNMSKLELFLLAKSILILI